MWRGVGNGAGGGGDGTCYGDGAGGNGNGTRGAAGGGSDGACCGEWHARCVVRGVAGQCSGAMRDNFFLATHSLFLETGLNAPFVSEKPG